MTCYMTDSQFIHNILHSYWYIIIILFVRSIQLLIVLYIRPTILVLIWFNNVICSMNSISDRFSKDAFSIFQYSALNIG